MFAIGNFQYNYRNISLNFTHSISSISLKQDQGLEVFFDFGLNSSKKDFCSKLPSFN